MTASEFSKPFLTARERKQYSVRRAMLSADCNAAAAPCFEQEISETYLRATHQPAGAGSITIPPEVLFGEGTRALNASTFTAGGAFVGEEVTPLFAYLFPQSIVMRLGARAIGGIGSSNPAGVRGNLRLPAGLASDEAEWLPENSAPAANHESTFGTANASAHRLFTKRRISRQLLLQTAQGDALPEILLMGAFAAAVDRAALAGNGGVQPLGLLNTPGVATAAMGTDGAAPTLAKLNEAEGDVITAKVPLTSPGWVLSAKVRQKLKNTQKATGTSSFLLETADNADRCNGFTSYATAYMPDNGTKGNGTGLGSAVFGGGWEWLFFCQFGGLEICSDPYTQAASGDVIVSLNAFADIVTPRPYAFAKIVDAITT